MSSALSCARSFSLAQFIWAVTGSRNVFHSKRIRAKRLISDLAERNERSRRFRSLFLCRRAFWLVPKLRLGNPYLASPRLADLREAEASKTAFPSLSLRTSKNA